MPELEPCPFCGGTAEVKFRKKYPGVVSKIECKGCGARTRVFLPGDTIDNRWNKRTK